MINALCLLSNAAANQRGVQGPDKGHFHLLRVKIARRNATFTHARTYTHAHTRTHTHTRAHYFATATDYPSPIDGLKQNQQCFYGLIMSSTNSQTHAYGATKEACFPQPASAACSCRVYGTLDSAFHLYLSPNFFRFCSPRGCSLHINLFPPTAITVPSFIYFLGRKTPQKTLSKVSNRTLVFIVFYLRELVNSIFGDQFTF